MKALYLIPSLCVALFLTLLVNPISYAQFTSGSQWKARKVFENLPNTQTENLTAPKVKNLAVSLLPASIKTVLFLQSEILKNFRSPTLRFLTPIFFRLARAPPA